MTEGGLAARTAEALKAAFGRVNNPPHKRQGDTAEIRLKRRNSDASPQCPHPRPVAQAFLGNRS